MRNMDYDPYRDAGCIGERNRCENGCQGAGCGGNCGRPGGNCCCRGPMGPRGPQGCPGPMGPTGPSIYAQQGKCRNHAAFSTLKTIKQPL